MLAFAGPRVIGVIGVIGGDGGGDWGRGVMGGVIGDSSRTRPVATPWLSLLGAVDRVGATSGAVGILVPSRPL